MSKLVLWMVERIKKQREANANWYAQQPTAKTQAAKRRQRREWMRRYRAKIRKQIDDIMKWDSNAFFAREKAKKDKRKVAKQVKEDKKKGIY